MEGRNWYKTGLKRAQKKEVQRNDWKNVEMDSVRYVNGQQADYSQRQQWENINAWKAKVDGVTGGLQEIMPMKQAFDFEPIPGGLDPKLEKHVLGAQACFWGEKAQNAQIVEFHFFPRMCAMSESVWCRKGTRDFESFMRRVEAQQKRYAAAGVNARPTVIPDGYKPYKKYDVPKPRGK